MQLEDNDVRTVVDPADIAAPSGPDHVALRAKPLGVVRFSSKGRMVIYATIGLLTVTLAYGVGVFDQSKRNSPVIAPPLQLQNKAPLVAHDNADNGSDELARLTDTSSAPPAPIQQQLPGNSAANNDALGAALAEGANPKRAAVRATPIPRPQVTFDTSGAIVLPAQGAYNPPQTVPNAGEISANGTTYGGRSAISNRAADAAAARRSSLYIGTDNAGQGGPAAASVAQSQPSGQTAAEPGNASGGAEGGAGLPAGQQQRLRFASDAGATQPYLPNLRTEALGKYELWAGSVIPAELDGGINTDMPGLAVAHVNRDVFDSRTGQTLVIPHGSRLVGHYNSVIASGQARVQVVWDKLTWPDGSYLILDNQPGTDTEGNAGLFADVNDHRGSIFTTTLLTGVIAGAGTLIAPNSYQGYANSAGQVVNQNVGQQLAQTGQQIIQQKAALPPTLTVPRGENFNVVLDRTIVLRPWVAPAEPAG